MKQNQWIHSSSTAKNTAIKDKGSRYRCYSGDRPWYWSWIYEEESKTAVKWIMNASHLFCSYFYFLIIPRLHSHPSAPESGLMNTGCFLEQNRVLLKPVLIHNMDAEDRLRSIFKAQLQIKSSRWLAQAFTHIFSPRWRKWNFHPQASNCDHEMTSRLYSSQETFSQSSQ